MYNDKPRQHEIRGNLTSKMSHSAAVFNLCIQMIFTEIRGAGVALCVSNPEFVTPSVELRGFMFNMSHLCYRR